MRVTRIEIRNFRSIRHLALDLGATTVLIGPNGVGKTAILDALRLMLTSGWGQRGTRSRRMMFTSHSIPRTRTNRTG